MIVYVLVVMSNFDDERDWRIEGVYENEVSAERAASKLNLSQSSQWYEVQVFRTEEVFA